MMQMPHTQQIRNQMHYCPYSTHSHICPLSENGIHLVAQITKLVRDGKQNRAKKEHVDLSKQRLNRIMTIFLAFTLCLSPCWVLYLYPLLFSQPPRHSKFNSTDMSLDTSLLSSTQDETHFPLKWFPKGGTFPKNSWPLASPYRGTGVTYLLTGLGDVTSLCGSVPPFLFLPRAHVGC